MSINTRLPPNNTSLHPPKIIRGLQEVCVKGWEFSTNHCSYHRSTMNTGIFIQYIHICNSSSKPHAKGSAGKKTALQCRGVLSPALLCDWADNALSELEGHYIEGLPSPPSATLQLCALFGSTPCFTTAASFWFAAIRRSSLRFSPEGPYTPPIGLHCKEVRDKLLLAE